MNRLLKWFLLPLFLAPCPLRWVPIVVALWLFAWWIGEMLADSVQDH